MFTVDAPLAQDLGSDDGSEDEDGQADEDDGSIHGSDEGEDHDLESDDDDDESSGEDDEDEDEQGEHSGSASESESDSGPEYDGTDLTTYIETGPNAPQIEVPAGVVDLPPSTDEGTDHKANANGKKRAIWHDPSDDLISVDLESDNRLKKLARGKKGTTVNGEELMKRLRKQ